MSEDKYPSWNEPNQDEIYMSYLAPQLPPPEDGEISGDPFERQKRVPGHDQKALSRNILLVGGGGLNSWIGLGLVRTGAKSLTIVDPDTVDRTNLTRQLFFARDLGMPKGPALASNLIDHSTDGARLTGIGMYFQEAVERFIVPCDVIVVGVDNNMTRLDAAIYARNKKIPAVFVALSKNGMRMNAFLQGSWDHDPCWHCAQPNLDPNTAAPCVPAVLSSCYLAAAIAIFFCHRAIMGWPDGVNPYNWWDMDLLGNNPDIKGTIKKRSNCTTCGGT